MNPLSALSSSGEQTVHETTAGMVELRSRQVSSPGQASRTVTALCIPDNICTLLLLATLIKQTECVVRHGLKGLLSTPHTLGISSQGTDIISEVSNSFLRRLHCSCTILILENTHPEIIVTQRAQIPVAVPSQPPREPYFADLCPAHLVIKAWMEPCPK